MLHSSTSWCAVVSPAAASVCLCLARVLGFCWCHSLAWAMAMSWNKGPKTAGVGRNSPHQGCPECIGSCWPLARLEPARQALLAGTNRNANGHRVPALPFAWLAPTEKRHAMALRLHGLATLTHLLLPAATGSWQSTASS